MSWQVLLGGKFEVRRSGKSLGRAPSRACGVLLLGLISRTDAWSSRTDLSQHLYPAQSSESARTALRQTISRLRSWLGDDALEFSHDLVRLYPGSWSYDDLLTSGQSAPAELIAPGLDHPWADEIRRQWRPTNSSHSPAYCEHAINAVESVSQIDPDAARAMLVGMSPLLTYFTCSQVDRLLSLTRPDNPYAASYCEYLEIKASLHIRLGAVASAEKELRHALRRATEMKDSAAKTRIRATIIFSLAERGHRSAGAWLKPEGEGARHHPHRLTLKNAEAAYFWNLNQLDSAIKTMEAGRESAMRAGKNEQIHFWTNYAVLAAEAGQFELSQEAEEIANSLMGNDLCDMGRWRLDLATAERWLKMRMPALAMDRLNRMGNTIEKYDWLLASIYYQECLAEAKALLGDSKAALETWNKAEALRLSVVGSLSPRIKARKQRLKSLI